MRKNDQIHRSWEEAIADAKAAGGREVLPNGLPVKCIMSDFTMLECEDGDHPTYICPVEVVDPTSDREGGLDVHAAIYCDGNIVLTLYECCYGAYRLKTGESVGPLTSWMDGTRLTEASRAMLCARFPRHPLPDVVGKSAPEQSGEAKP